MKFGVHIARSKPLAGLNRQDSLPKVSPLQDVIWCTPLG